MGCAGNVSVGEPREGNSYEALFHWPKNKIVSRRKMWYLQNLPSDEDCQYPLIHPERLMPRLRLFIQINDSH